MKRLSDIQFFLLDMDGTFYLGDKLIDGSMDFLHTLDAQGKGYAFLTNNSSKNRYAYQKKLAKLGCHVNDDRVFTSGEATTIYLNKISPKANIYLLGTQLLEEEFTNSGFNIINNSSIQPDFVVLGFDTTLTYDKLWKACDYIREGVPYIATHPDFNCPLEGGRVMPDAGAMISFIEASTGRKPHIVGKPNKDIIDAVCEKYGLEKENVAMVGDRLYTDIKTGENANIISILVLSGETTREAYEASDIKADHILPSLKELGEAIL